VEILTSNDKKSSDAVLKANYPLNETGTSITFAMSLH